MKLIFKNANDEHEYYLNGPRSKGITSVSSVGLDMFNLNQWSRRQVAIGLAIKPGLLESISAQVDNNTAVNKLCDEAAKEAGAHEGRDRGNVLHTALEMHDTGKRFIPTDLTSTAIVDWEHICKAMQWKVELVERCVVWPDERICGRFDRIVSGPPCEKCGRTKKIVDFKSGARILAYPHAIACQLALYANAPLLAGPIPDGGGFTEHFEPMPEMCLCVGYAIHLPPDTHAQNIEVDIERGMNNVRNVIFPTLEWRAAKGLAKIVELPSYKGTWGVWNPSVETDDPFAGLPNETNAPVLNKAPTPLIDLTTRQWNIADRLTFLKKNHTEMAQIVAGRWPEGVPNIKMPLTSDDLDRIEAVLIDAERAVEAPFDPVQIATDDDVRVGLQAALDELGMTWDELAYQDATGIFITDLARRTWLAYSPLSVPGEQPHGTPTPLTEEPPAPGQRIYAYDDGQQWDGQPRDIDEGPDMAPADIAAFKATFADLDAEQQVRIDAWAAQAHEAGVSISMRDKPSKRRFSIGRFLLIASHHHEDVVRAVLSLALGDEIQTVITTGSVLGVLTQQEAEKAWEILLGVDGGAYSWDVVRRKLVAA